jgi:8-oxo-dGTP diphosphatase
MFLYSESTQIFNGFHRWKKNKPHHLLVLLLHYVYSDMKLLQVAIGVIKNAQGQVLISLRDGSLHQGGLWEFPGGKIESEETTEQALARELKEELAITVLAATPLITFKHQYPDLAVQLHVFLVEHFSGDAKSCEGQPFKWVNLAELRNHSFPAANQPIITAAQLPPYYAILDDADESLLLGNLQKILTRGIKLIQLRLKTLPPETIEKFIEQAYPLCRQHGALLLMNSAVKNAADFAVDGIHLTSQHLMTVSRRPASPNTSSKQAHWIAASCHNLQELLHAQSIGVDFVVLAPLLATKTHPEKEPLGWEQFAKLVSKVNLPVYALGGLSESGLDRARQAGGQGIAAIRAFLE